MGIEKRNITFVFEIERVYFSHPLKKISKTMHETAFSFLPRLFDHVTVNEPYWTDP